MNLTERLLKIAQLVEYKTVADIGTDHAKLPVYLINNRICNKVIASDVADGPVKACESTVSRYQLKEFIHIRKGNGLDTLSVGEVETIVIAGMGGDLISEILQNGDQVAKKAKEIILQPMTHIPQLRQFLKNNNYKIIEELLVKENNKIYTIIKVTHGKNQYVDEIDFIVSPLLMKKKDEILVEYILKLLNKYKTELIGLKKAVALDESSISVNLRIIKELEKLYEAAKDC